ncbi:MAG: hypothetical protein NZM25_11520 [Leptospiraceae bacterium]|nr:hypothetical protein [Leptospiraceae bacterium]MDW8307434.1 STAS domain-containing protein [Leptospiraceae bacterium]
MQITKSDKLWQLAVEEQDNQLGLINLIRYLEKLHDEIASRPTENLIVELDLSKLRSVNSELIAQFVNLQSVLVRTDGRLQLVRVNRDLKSNLDVVMLDKIVSITYQGQEEGEDFYAAEEE